MPASGELTITWDAKDPDGDPLTYTVQYSPSGHTWQALGVNLTDTSLKVNLADLAGSEDAMLQVTASDGFNSSTDMTDFPFSVPYKGPSIYLASPAEGDEYYTDAPVVLEAMGTDKQYGPMQDEAFTWSSDRDGNLGSGRNLVVYSLSEGDHTITLTGHSNAGMFATQVVHIHIGARPAAGPLPTETPRSGSGISLGTIPTWMLVVIAALLLLLFIAVLVIIVLLVRRKK